MRDKVYIGDCRTVLPTLPENSVQCCVTSPPYFGQRDYGHTDQIGLEKTPEQYVEQLVAVFREVRRVLRGDGTLWVNIGDSYATNGQGGGASQSLAALADRYAPCKNPRKPNRQDNGRVVHAPKRVPDGLKEKDLIGIPWRVAFALQADGWYLRQDIIWHKPNPMPESVTDRCTKAHEYLFLFSKNAKYHFDYKSLREPLSAATIADGRQQRGTRGKTGEYAAVDGNCGFSTDGLRNKRSVWMVNTHPYSGAHFAVFPPALIEPCIIAGCPSGGTVLDPFFGSGTTGEVCERLGRHWIGIELNQNYAALHERTKQQGLSL